MSQRSISWILIVLAATVGALVGCRRSSAYPSATRDVMGTSVTVVLYDPGLRAEDAKPAFDEVFSLLAAWERMTLLPGTENQVAALSQGAGNQSVPIDKGVFDMLMAALRLYDASGKAFDIRYGPLLDLWGFNKKPRVPTQAELDSALALVGDGGMFVAGNSILLAKKGMRFDARDIALGWAFDQVAAALTARGIRTAMIASPRVCRTMGDPPERGGFPFVIAHPLTGQPGWATVHVPVGGTACVVAGANRFQSGGKAYHSVLDPRTGKPADRCVAAVVQSSDATTAQALAYAVFVHGTTDSLAPNGVSAVGGYAIARQDAAELAASAGGSLAGKFDIAK